MKFLLLFLIPIICEAQWVFNTDIKRGNQNQYIYIEGSPKNNLLASSEVISISNDTFTQKATTWIDTVIPKKKSFVPTPTSAAKAGFIMMDSVINGKTVKIIKEDLSGGKPKKSTSRDSFASSGGYNNIAIGMTSGTNNNAIGYNSLAAAYDTPEPGEKLQLCRYCDLMRTLAHRIYIAKMMGSGYVQIAKGVWAYTD